VESIALPIPFFLFILAALALFIFAFLAIIKWRVGEGGGKIENKL